MVNKEAERWIRDLRRWFHQHAELSFQEIETARWLGTELRTLGLDISYRRPGHGVVACQHNCEGIPTVALRAEMDALPGKETTGLAFVSLSDKTMHACGHDAQMVMVLAAPMMEISPRCGSLVLLKVRRNFLTNFPRQYE